MNTKMFQSSMEDFPSKSIFKVIDSIWNCVWKIIFTQQRWRIWNIYKISLLGTSNWWDDLDGVWLHGIYKSPEKIPWLLFIMFKLFIEYISSIDDRNFTINICNPLLTLDKVYKNLCTKLIKDEIIDSRVIDDTVIVLRCN